MIKQFITTTILILLFLPASQAHATDRSAIHGPIVVELFTSQSCSSCPPADILLSKIARQPDVITLGFHVDYWDHLRWEDTYSRAFSSQRQKSYAQMSDGRVYTPQMIVNGAQRFVGYKESKLNAALQSAAPIKLIELRQDDNGMITLSLPQVPRGNYTIRLYGIGEDGNVKIGSGENRGYEVTYASPVLGELNMGSWNGSAKTMMFPLPQNPEITHYIALAQSGVNGHGRIAAAGKTQ